MYALISPNETSNKLGFRVSDVVETTFEIALPMFWVNCSVDVVADCYYFDSNTREIKEIIQNIPNEEIGIKVRTTRDKLLLDSDWTQLQDARIALGAEKATQWDTYRQDLRNLPAQVEFPIDTTWPVRP